eukprot:4760124-Prymnesium_polylepis.1
MCIRDRGAYRQMQLVVDHVNSLIAAHNDDAGRGGRRAPPAPLLSLEAGSVVFGAAKQGWMASLDSFARLYAAKATEGDADDGGGGGGGGGGEAFEAARAKALRAMSGAQREKRVVQLVLTPLAELHALAGEGAAAELDAKLRKVSGGRLGLTKGVRGSTDAKALRRDALK